MELHDCKRSHFVLGICHCIIYRQVPIFLLLTKDFLQSYNAKMAIFYHLETACPHLSKQSFTIWQNWLYRYYKTSTSVWMQDPKTLFCEHCLIFLFFLPFLAFCTKTLKRIFQPAFGLRSTQTLVKIYNIQIYNAAVIKESQPNLNRRSSFLQPLWWNTKNECSLPWILSVP